MTESDDVIGVLATVFADDEATIDEAFIEGLIEVLRPMAADDLVCEMRGSDPAFVGTYEGIDGLREAWRDWLETFSEVRLEIEDVQRFGDNIYAAAMQAGITRHGGVELTQPSASVWKLRDGRIHRVEFHLDREVAVSSAQRAQE